MRRDLFNEDHEAFRQLARDFKDEIGPHCDDREKTGRMPRGILEKLCRQIARSVTRVKKTM